MFQALLPRNLIGNLSAPIPGRGPWAVLLAVLLLTHLSLVVWVVLRVPAGGAWPGPAVGAMGSLAVTLAALALLLRWGRRWLAGAQVGDVFFDLSPDVLWVMAADGVIQRCNPASGVILGFPSGALSGYRMVDLVHPEDRTVVEDCLAALGSLGSVLFEVRCRCAAGGYKWMVWSLSPGPGGLGYCAAGHDLTERREAEAVLGRFETVLDGLDTALFVADAKTDEILFANRAFKTVHGADCVGRTVRGVDMPQPERGDYRVDPRNLTAADLPRELFDGELQQPHSGRWYHVREQATRWVDGRVVRMGIATEITDRKHMEQVTREQEERLARTSRLITMGEMASTLAHELNQPLAAIANYSRGCVTRLASGDYRLEEILGAMEKASAQAERAGKVIRRIRDFVRKSEPKRAPVALAEVMDDALGIAEMETRKAGVGLTVDVAEDLPRVFADRIMVEQVLLNLIRNGVEAMQDTPLALRQLSLRAWPRLDESVVEIAVADRGHGIGEEDRARLFKSFFSTKAEGMGMGLNICRSIVEFHRGRLWVEPNPLGGTIFHFTLPLEALSEPGTQ